MPGLLMAGFRWVYFLLRLCSIFKIIPTLWNFGLFSTHYGCKLWIFCILLVFSREGFPVISAVILLVGLAPQILFLGQQLQAAQTRQTSSPPLSLSPPSSLMSIADERRNLLLSNKRECVTDTQHGFSTAEQKQIHRSRERLGGCQVGGGLGAWVKKVKGWRSTNW